MPSDTSTSTTPEYLEVDPAELVIGANVRIDRRIDKDFLSSIEEHGVLQPIIGYRDPDGRIVVRYGSRRTVAAVEAKRALVPVVVGRSPDDVERIATQVAENEARAALSTGETMAAMEQLAAFGLTAAQIARKTGAKRQKVTAALTVSGSALATAATDRYELTLDQAAAVAEFDAEPEAVKALVAAASTGQFDHVVQRMRDDRAEAEAMEAARAELAAAKVVVIDRGEFSWPGQRLDNLGIPEEEHRACPGHAAFLGWRLDDDRRRVPSAVYVCSDAVGYGHMSRPAPGGEAGKRPMSDAEKAERRRVIRLNKEWGSATTVRREFLAAFAMRKAAPAGAELFVLTALLSGDHEIKQAMEVKWPMLRAAIGVGGAEDNAPAWVAGGQECAALIEAMATAPAKRVLVVLASAVLMAWETKTGPHTWRHQSAQTLRYLTQLADWGYQLSDVERIACGEDVETEQAGGNR